MSGFQVAITGLIGAVGGPLAVLLAVGLYKLIIAPSAIWQRQQLRIDATRRSRERERIAFEARNDSLEAELEEERKLRTVCSGPIELDTDVEQRPSGVEVSDGWVEYVRVTELYAMRPISRLFVSSKTAPLDAAHVEATYSLGPGATPARGRIEKGREAISVSFDTAVPQSETIRLRLASCDRVQGVRIDAPFD